MSPTRNKLCEFCRSHGGEGVDIGLLGYNAMCTYREIQTFQLNILPPKHWYVPKSLRSIIVTHETKISLSNFFPDLVMFMNDSVLGYAFVKYSQYQKNVSNKSFTL